MTVALIFPIDGLEVGHILHSLPDVGLGLFHCLGSELVTEPAGAGVSGTFPCPEFPRV